MPFIKKTDEKYPQEPIDTGKIFIGRTNELHFFVQHILKPEDPTYNIVSISGQGGVGKSTLIARYIDEAHTTAFRDYCLTALVDEHQITLTSLMEKFADQLHIEGQFKKVLTTYKQALGKLRPGREAIRKSLLEKAPDFADAAVAGIPFVGPILGEGVKVTTGHLLDKFHTAQIIRDTERLEDPVGDLTKAFVEELNDLANTHAPLGSYWAKRRRVILFFDTFEQLAVEVTPWLLDHFLKADINNNIVLVIAGREPLERSTYNDPKRWLPYYDNNIINSIALDSFTEDETRLYLIERGITEQDRIATIWHLSRGLPLYLDLLTSNLQGKVDPTADVVVNFLRWIPEREHIKRRLALDSALLSKPFNQDDLTAFKYLPENEIASLYRWLIEQPFVRSSLLDGRYSYHELAQELFSRHLYQRSPREYYATRRALATLYQQQLEEIQVDGAKEMYNSTEGVELAVALAHQFFLLPDEISHMQGIEQILHIHKLPEQAGEILRMLRELSQKQSFNQINANALATVNILQQYIEASLVIQITRGATINQRRDLLAATNDLLEKVGQKPSFSRELLADLYLDRGGANSYIDLQRAMEDFDSALKLDANSAWTYARRGKAYRLQGDTKQAIENYNRALELNPRFGWSYAERGITYRRLLNEHELAIADYDRALELDPHIDWFYNSRGQAYRILNQYQRAIKDFDHALAINPQYTWVYIERGITYGCLNEYQRAIEDFNHVIDLYPNYACAYAQRGETFRLLKKYQQAIEDFNCCFSFDPKSEPDYTYWGENYNLKYRQVIKDFDHALELNSKYAWAYTSRGQAYFSLEKYHQAIKDFDYALMLDPQYVPAYYFRGITHLWQKDIKRAEDDFTRNWEIDPRDAKVGWMAEWSRMCQEGMSVAKAERLEIISSVDKQCYVAHVCQGIALWLRKHFGEGLIELEQAILLEPKAYDAYFWKGMICVFLEEYEDAVAALEKALTLEIPLALLAPLRYLEQDKPDFYEHYITPLLIQ